jgi:hypothetical protein
MTKPTPDPPTAIATIVLPADALRDALLAALVHPNVIAALADALAARGTVTAPLPKFMSPKEYAAHSKVSLRTLHYQRIDMTEGVHFSKTGSRVRFHVEQADAFLSAAKGIAAVKAKDAASLVALARTEASQRPLKSSPKGKRHATK